MLTYHHKGGSAGGSAWGARRGGGAVCNGRSGTASRWVDRSGVEPDPLLSSNQQGGVRIVAAETGPRAGRGHFMVQTDQVNRRHLGAGRAGPEWSPVFRVGRRPVRAGSIPRLRSVRSASLTLSPAALAAPGQRQPADPQIPQDASRRTVGADRRRRRRAEQLLQQRVRPQRSQRLPRHFSHTTAGPGASSVAAASTTPSSIGWASAPLPARQVGRLLECQARPSKEVAPATIQPPSTSAIRRRLPATRLPSKPMAVPVRLTAWAVPRRTVTGLAFRGGRSTR